MIQYLLLFCVGLILLIVPYIKLNLPYQNLYIYPATVFIVVSLYLFYNEKKTVTEGFSNINTLQQNLNLFNSLSNRLVLGGTVNLPTEQIQCYEDVTNLRVSNT